MYVFFYVMSVGVSSPAVVVENLRCVACRLSEMG